MWDYQQCRVVHAFAGADYDGFAIEGFASEADFKERFYAEPSSRALILDDIVQMADVERSPRRVWCREWRYC
jgi:hypothetical protein